MYINLYNKSSKGITYNTRYNLYYMGIILIHFIICNHLSFPHHLSIGIYFL